MGHITLLLSGRSLLIKTCFTKLLLVMFIVAKLRMKHAVFHKRPFLKLGMMEETLQTERNRLKLNVYRCFKSCVFTGTGWCIKLSWPKDKKEPYPEPFCLTSVTATCYLFWRYCSSNCNSFEKKNIFRWATSFCGTVWTTFPVTLTVSGAISLKQNVNFAPFETTSWIFHMHYTVQRYVVSL